MCIDLNGYRILENILFLKWQLYGIEFGLDRINSWLSLILLTIDDQSGYSSLFHTILITKELGTVISTGDIGVGEDFTSVVQINHPYELCVIWINRSKVHITRTFHFQSKARDINEW